MVTRLDEGVDDGGEHRHSHMLSPFVHKVSWLAYLGGGLFGAADCLFNTQVYALMADVFPAAESAHGFTFFQLLVNVGSAVGFVLPLVTTDATVHIGLQVVALVVSVLLAMLMKIPTPS